MSGTKKYWNSVQHLEGDETFLKTADKEFAEQIPVEDFLSKTPLESTTTSRRDFLKFLGFSVSAATLAACETPVIKSVPYVVLPEEIVPGVPNYYASTYYDGNDYASILVKTREGRPIHIKGNDRSELTKGAINARVNSSLLDLYDSKRFTAPQKAGTQISWENADKEIKEKLRNTIASGKKVVIMTNSIISPSTISLVNTFAGRLSSYSNLEELNLVEHVTYDALSSSAILNANNDTFGSAVIPTYNFDKAKVIVSFGADFLSNWLMSTTYTKQYAQVRKPEADWMTKHYQIETGMSLSGSNADVRMPVKPSELGKLIVMLYNEIAKKAGAPALKSSPLKDDNLNLSAGIKSIATELWKNRNNGLVISGSNDTNTQLVINSINNLLGSYSNTIDIQRPCYLKKGKDADVVNLVSEMKSGKIGAIIFNGIDPVYSLSNSLDFNAALSKVSLKVSTDTKPNQTTALCDFVCPDHHYLESWNDAQPSYANYSLIQPVINPLYKTRQFQETLMAWANIDGTYYDNIKDNWNKDGYPTSGASSFRNFWNNSLRDGVYSAKIDGLLTGGYNLSSDKLARAADNIYSIKSSDWELELYTKTSIGDGRHADNPWLQELPDPITKVVWDNYIAMNPVDMKEMGFTVNLQQETPANIAKVTASGKEISLPVFPVPGQKRKTIGIALGYGKTIVDDKLIGKNAYPFLTTNSQNDILFYNTDVKIESTGETYLMASSQTHNTIMDKDLEDPEIGRKIVNETTIATYKKGKDAYNPTLTLVDSYGEEKTTDKLDLWAPHKYDTFGHRWGMTIDLNSCIGCSSCVTACHSENNVPVVGKDEVRRNRDMFWLRIDRYFSSDMDVNKAEEEGLGSWEMYSAMEKPEEYPQVVFQPVMCQHCNHAPCETVCPVAATTHSNEGLNQMTYNRCVGTRYCANNCPYKVRRFNWFQYDKYKKFSDVNPSQDTVGRMVLNPDVTVRSRGVMEKCSMCVQRIQAGKLDAKKKKDKVQDGAIKMACEDACPTNAITFGDLNDSGSNVRKEFNNDRAYALLEEVGTQPNVKYLTKVRNIAESEA